MKRVISVIATAILVLAISACSSIDSGKITSKHSSPGYTYIQQQCIVAPKGGCSGFVPIIITVPPSWTFELEENKETGWVTVDNKTFDNYEVGDIYP